MLGTWNHLNPDQYIKILLNFISEHLWWLWMSLSFIRYVILIWFSNLTLPCFSLTPALVYIQIRFQLTTQYIFYMFWSILVTINSHIQPVTLLEGTCSVLLNLSAVNCKIDRCGVIWNLVNTFWNHIKIIIQAVC